MRAHHRTEGLQDFNEREVEIMKITDIKVTNLNCKLKKPLKIAKMIRNKSNSTIVKITTDQGIYGYGEATFAHFFSGETQSSARHVIENFIAPLIKGKNPIDLLPMIDSINNSIAGNPFAKAAVEIALWDIIGKFLKVPVYTLLGGARRRKIPVCQSISYGEPDEMAEEAIFHVKAGFKTLKIYCGRESLDQDLQRIKTIKDSINNNVKIYVEANQRWNYKDVKKILPDLENLGILFIEQPIPITQRRELKLIRESTILPLALDESVFTPEDIVQAVLDGSIDIANIYVLKAGGIYTAKKEVEIAEALGLRVFIGSLNELSISTMAGAHIASIIQDNLYPSYLVGPLLYESDFLIEPIKIENGLLFLNDKPGLGINVDEDILKNLSIE